jgi:hypothetical protein
VRDDTAGKVAPRELRLSERPPVSFDQALTICADGFTPTKDRRVEGEQGQHPTVFIVTGFAQPYANSPNDKLFASAMAWCLLNLL